MKLKIFINQIGYPCDAKKTAIICGEYNTFSVINAITKEVVFKGKLIKNPVDILSGDKTCTADFSEITELGKYYIKVNKCTSSVFSILTNPYKNFHSEIIKSFYFLRCGMDLTTEYAGIYTHPKCHTTLAYDYFEKEKPLDLTGGWHQAGDYGKFTIAATSSLGHLLYAFELFPDAFDINLNIPESFNDVPDILNECRYEIEWLLKMQKRDGSVIHKVTPKKFCEMIMPQDDHQKQYYFNTCTCSTAAFCAVMALAARIYEKFDRKFSDSLITASLKAWDWISENPIYSEFKNPPDVETSIYTDKYCVDEIYWAACELFRLTNGKEFFDIILKNYNHIDRAAFGWQEVGGFGSLSFYFNKDANSKTIKESIKQSFISRADEILYYSDLSAYKTSLKKSDYIWGSNSIVLNNAIVLIIANIINPDDEYINCIMEQFNYILGKNPLGKCYVTGFGSNPVMYPHHRQCDADGINEPIPGFIIGGPNADRIDNYIRAHTPPDIAPPKCYADHEYSYSTNESALYWNSPGVFVSSYIYSKYNNKKEVSLNEKNPSISAIN